jgi:hypothetical protein
MPALAAYSVGWTVAEDGRPTMAGIGEPGWIVD